MMLAPGHRDDLHRSGLTEETIALAGIYSATGEGVRDLLGFGAGPGMVFPYPSLNGEPPYARVKLDHSGPDGKRYRSPKGQRNRLYVPANLDPKVLFEPTVLLWVTEGEKKALAVCQAGLPCVALPGVWSWKTRDAKDRSRPIPDLDAVVWSSRTVYLAFDSDVASKSSVQFAEFKLAQELHRRGAKVFAIRLPGDPNGEKVGLDDYLMTHSVEALCAIEPVEIHDPAVKSAPEARGTHQDLTSGGDGITVSGSFRLTDLGNAERLVARYGAHIRYVPQWGWLVWDGRRWARDEGECEVRRLAAQTIRQIYAEAARLEDKEERKALVQHARRSEARPRLEAMVKLAEPKVAAKPSAFDRDPWLLNVENGIIDLKTGRLSPHRSENFITRLAPIRFDSQASAPTWGRFLHEVFERREALICFLQKAMGYSLTGLTDEQVLFILYGVGANGKSTLLRAFRAVLGDYALQTPAETLLVKRDGHIPNDLARLKGARLVTAVETEDGRQVAEVLVKQMTGGDPVTARFLHREFFEFVPEFKLFVAANHKPRIRGTDHAIWRRVRLVPFNVVFTNPDRTLPNRLLAELPGILAWAVEGCRLWQAEGLGLPEEVRVATDTYRQEQDVVGQFIEERCVAAPNAQIKFSDLYDDYVTWCQRNGEEPLKESPRSTLGRERLHADQAKGRQDLAWPRARCPGTAWG